MIVSSTSIRPCHKAWARSNLRLLRFHNDSQIQRVRAFSKLMVQVTDDLSSRPNDTKSLILPLKRSLYPVRIPPQHHQLKNFISTTHPNIIYYASENEVYALHKDNGKRELIASLPWTPQCLDAAHGWVCVGGPDTGRCAFIFVGDRSNKGDLSPAARLSHAEVDALLPLDLDPESRLLDHHSFVGSQRQAPNAGAKPEVHTHELGSSIVNSVTIYRLRSDQPALRDQTVVILT